MSYIGKQPTKAALTSSDIEDGIITAAKIEDGAVVAAEIASNAVTTAKINADAVTGAKIADDVINSEHIVADSIDAEHYAAGSVDTTALGADAVTGAKIADDAINSEHYTDGSIDTAHIADGQVTAAKLASGTVQNQSAFKNIIINGDMRVSQRATSKTGITSDGYYTVDRFLVENGSFGTWTQTQAADAPTGQGYYNSLKMDCTTAQGSPAGNSILLVGQSIEGFMLQPIKQGTANAESTTLSFWHKHTKTGTNIVELLDADNSNAVSGSYTQSVSNTWEKATITFPANTSGTYGNDNARSLRIRFIMGSGTDYTSGTLATTWQTSVTDANRYVGQVNNADSTSNNFIITGVQYEVGTSASDFEFLPIDINLQRCQRYYHLVASGSGVNINFVSYNTASNTSSRVFLPTTMRANPTLDITTGTNYYQAYRGGGSDHINAFTLDTSRPNYMYFYDNQTSSGTVGYSGQLNTSNSSSYLAADAEL